MTIQDKVKTRIHQLLNQHGYAGIKSDQVVIQFTKPDFEGDYTLVTFGLSKIQKAKPEVIGQSIGELLLSEAPDMFSAYNVIKGFLNLSLQNDVLTSWLKTLNEPSLTNPKNKTVRMIEYSSPNTNKPLHFGHMRNIFLGDAMSRIMNSDGDEIIRANLINDRGIHICKSMLAWDRWGDGATPSSTGIKGDHFVGDFYVLFEKKLNEQLDEMLPKILQGEYTLEIPENQALLSTEIENYQNANTPEEKENHLAKIKSIAKKDLPLIRDAREILRKWEAGDEDTRSLWSRMNGWVYEGFRKTYDRMGIHFDKMYYESETYELGKEMVLHSEEEGQLYKKEDGSIWVDLEDEGLDQKILLRKDGTAVYITQDIGTAKLKFEDYPLDQSIYVIGDEQNYHMKVLQLTLKKMGEEYADKIFHLSYGMVELPDGKMKSREGNVVDADQMLDEMKAMAKERSQAAEKSLVGNTEDLDALYEMIGIGAIKFFLLRVSPKKKMLFDPEESIDLQGFTATAIQYAHARICSILRKAEKSPNEHTLSGEQIESPLERNQILKLSEYMNIIESTAQDMDPSLLCNYIYDLSRGFNAFYDKCSILNADSDSSKNLRLVIAVKTAMTIKTGMKNLGIDVPEKM